MSPNRGNDVRTELRGRGGPENNTCIRSNISCHGDSTRLQGLFTSPLLPIRGRCSIQFVDIIWILTIWTSFRHRMSIAEEGKKKEQERTMRQASLGAHEIRHLASAIRLIPYPTGLKHTSTTKENKMVGELGHQQTGPVLSSHEKKRFGLTLVTILDLWSSFPLSRRLIQVHLSLNIFNSRGYTSQQAPAYSILSNHD